MKIKKGFILGGGEGTRLYPLTLEIPKPLIPVGKKPVISYLVELYLKNGINDIKINVQEKHIADFYKWKITHFPKEKIEFIIESYPSGTFTPFVKKTDPDWFNEAIVISNGDELKQVNIKEMFNWHKKQNVLATIALVKVKNPESYGTVKIKDNKIIEFVEKSKNPPSNYVNCGLYIMEPEVRNYFPENAKFSMSEIDLFPKLAKQDKLAGYKWEGKWNDTGTFKRWEEAIKNWSQ